MKWVLVSPDGAVVRSVDADHKAEARFRLAPLPFGHYVTSAVAVAAMPVRAPKRKDMSKARIITNQQRRAIAEGNTRRMAERKGWRKPNPEVARRKNAKWVAKQIAANPNHLADRREARRRSTIVKHAVIAPEVIGLTMERHCDRDIAAHYNVPEQVVNDIRTAYKVRSSRELIREQRRVLFWYYRHRVGLSIRAAAARIGVSPRHVRTLDLSRFTGNV